MIPEGARLAVWAFAAAAIASAFATWAALGILQRRQILDHPNERSSHSQPTPRGGGIGILAALLPVLALILALSGDLGAAWPILAGAVVLAAVSWIDDLGGVRARYRLLVQAVAVAVGLWLLPGDILLLQGVLPFWPDRLVAGLAWLWFINVFNFMDGADGVAGGEALAVGVGLTLIGLSFQPYAPAAPLAAAIAGA